MGKQRTVVYVDGFNLYHGALRHTPYKWLDILSLVKKLIDANKEIDSDLTTPVKLCIGKYGKCVGVINPQKQKCRTLEESATFYKHIRETALAASQFPAVLHDATGTFHKPARW